MIAALLVFGGLLFVGSVLTNHYSPAVTGAIVTGTMFVMVPAVLIVMNLGRKVRTDPTLFEDRLRDMEARGQIVKTDHKAHRAFEVEEFEDEGLHFFVEVEDGGVLYLTGQYLYDYQPSPRLFPCTEFTVIQNKDKGWVEDVQCRGTALEPEIVCPPFSKEFYKNGLDWADGDIIRDRTYDQLKTELAKG
jgi:hypothetical protein